MCIIVWDGLCWFGKTVFKIGFSSAAQTHNAPNGSLLVEDVPLTGSGYKSCHTGEADISFTDLIIWHRMLPAIFLDKFLFIYF